mgnify:CR=1 FL=1
MKNEVVPVQIRGLLPTNSGCAIFVGNDQKVFVIQVEHNMGAVIGMFLRDTPKERPLTHDLIMDIFKGLGVAVDRVVITDLKNSTQLYREIGDAPAFGRVLTHFEILKAAVAAEGGCLVKKMGDAVLAAFPRPLPALRAVCPRPR